MLLDMSWEREFRLPSLMRLMDFHKSLISADYIETTREWSKREGEQLVHVMRESNYGG